jgi:uncharacterized protein
VSGSPGLQAALRALLEVRGITSAAVAGADGELVDGLSLGEEELAALRELIPTALASSRALGGLLEEGSVRQALIEYREGPVLLAPIEGGSGDEGGPVAVIGLANVTDLGRVRFQLKRHLAALAEALQAREAT